MVSLGGSKYCGVRDFTNGYFGFVCVFCVILYGLYDFFVF